MLFNVKWVSFYPYHGENKLLFNVKWVFFHPYHGENKLLLDAICNVCFVLDQYNQLYFYNARSPKQQSTCRHIASLGYIILVPSRSYSLLLLAQKQQSTCRHIASLGYTILVPSRPNSLLLLAQRRSSKYKCYCLWVDPIRNGTHDLSHSLRSC